MYDTTCPRFGEHFTIFVGGSNEAAWSFPVIAAFRNAMALLELSLLSRQQKDGQIVLCSVRHHLPNRPGSHQRCLLLMPLLILQMPCVMVPMGQKAHQLLGLNRTITMSPMSVDVSIRL